MSQRRSRSIDALTIGAVAGPLVALVVLLVDGYLVATQPDGAAALLNDQFPWLLVATPVFLLTGFIIGSNSRPIVPLLVILVAIAEERFQQQLLPGGGINLRLDEVLAPAITLGLLARELLSGRLRRDAARVPGLVPLGLFLLANLIPTALLMRDHARGASLFAILLAGAGCYVGVAILAARIGSVREVVAPLAAIGAMEAAFGLGAVAVSVWQGQATPLGVQVEPVTHIFEAYGTMFEANFFGQYLAAVFLIVLAFLAQWASQGHLWSKEGLLLTGAALLTVAGVLASETRASWLGLLAGALVVVLLRAIQRPSAERRSARGSARRAGASWRARWLPSLAMVALLVAAVGTAYLFSDNGTPIGQRFASIVDFNTGSGYGRLRILRLVLADLTNPIIGMGDGSFNSALPAAPGAAPDPHPWIYSMFLAVFHDAGIVGLLLWLAFLGIIYFRLVQVIRGDAPTSVQTLAVASAAAMTCLLIAGQATTGMYLIFFWTFLGVAGAVPGLRAATRRSAAEPRDRAVGEMIPAVSPPVLGTTGSGAEGASLRVVNTGDAE